MINFRLEERENKSLRRQIISPFLAIFVALIISSFFILFATASILVKWPNPTPLVGNITTVLFGSYFTDFQMGYVDMEVIVVDKLTYASNIDYLPEGAKLIKKDINDLTYDDIGEIQYCVNFAAESHVDNSIDDGSPFVKTNVNGTFNLLELCRQMKNFKKL